ncbi:MAG: LapA family protein [Anaerolineaceae bacterium]|nr:MAG: LapA family protein [Anaerolineaceae bacterium]
MGTLSQRQTRIDPKTTKRVKMSTLIIVLIIVAVVTVFSVQNAIPVAILFLFWKFEASLAIVLFLCVLTGVAIGIIGVSLFRKKLSRNKQASIDRVHTHAL